VVTIAGQTVDVGLPIYLPRIDENNKLCVSPTTGGTLMLPDVPGFTLTVEPGSATFPGGSKTGCITVTPVNGDKVPMSPGFGQQPRFVVTIQPVGTVFSPAAKITLPNVDGLAPRAVTEMYSYDHDLASFVSIGTGTVSDDGAIISSDPGVGVIKAGWHCGGNPNPTGSVGTCPTCKKCEGTDCVTDASKNGQAAAGEKCKNCQNGSPVPRMTDAQCCAAAPGIADAALVVCCNANKLFCLGPYASEIAPIQQCTRVHEETHFNHIDCPTGAAECDLSRPPFKPSVTPADGECEASQNEMACLTAYNCGGDVACQQRVAQEIVFVRNYGNGFKPGCFP
jgi:hypothetical protein